MEYYKKPRVIIFGGGFNPPTSAHAKIASACLALDGFEQVWMMPSGDRWDKKMASTDTDRIAMLNLMKSDVFNNDPRLSVIDFELNLPRPTQTIKTIGCLAASYSDIDFWYCYGSDSYLDMPTWSNGQELQKNLNMIVISRDSQEITERPGLINLKLELDESSTMVREAVCSGLPIDRMACGAVEQYIIKNSLYREGLPVS